ETTAPLSAAVVNEIMIVGSRCGPFAPALESLAEGEIDPRPLVTARYPLDDAERAIAHAAEPDALKVLVEP
ncbi:MAG: alcohol dehydrogenase, partial [Planctomycetota bacterium]